MPGSGYTVNPTVVISGGGGRDGAATAAVISNWGTGCVLGTPVVVGGAISSIPIAQAGSGYTSAPPILISDPSGRGASATAVLGGLVSNVTAVNHAPTVAVNGNTVALNGPFWTNSTHETPFVAYQLLCGGVGSVVIQAGGSGYTSPVATPSGGGGTGLVLGTPTLLSGVITAISATYSASAAGKVYVTDNNGTGSGFVGGYTVTTPGTSGQVTWLIESGGSGYSTNLTLSVGTAVTITVSNGVIGSVPVVSPGVGYTSQPAIAIADGTGSGAVVAPIMTGPAPSDTVTYSAGRLADDIRRHDPGRDERPLVQFQRGAGAALRSGSAHDEAGHGHHEPVRVRQRKADDPELAAQYARALAGRHAAGLESADRTAGNGRGQ